MVPDSVVKFMFSLEDELGDTSVSSLTMQIDTGTPSFEMDMTSQQEHLVIDDDLLLSFDHQGNE